MSKHSANIFDLSLSQKHFLFVKGRGKGKIAPPPQVGLSKQYDFALHPYLNFPKWTLHSPFCTDFLMVNNLHNILNHRASKYVKLARMWDNTRNFSSKSVCVVHNRSSANWAKCHSFLAILAENMSCTTARHRKATWDFETNRTLYQSSNLVFKSAHSDLYLYALPFESLV